MPSSLTWTVPVDDQKVSQSSLWLAAGGEGTRAAAVCTGSGVPLVLAALLEAAGLAAMALGLAAGALGAALLAGLFWRWADTWACIAGCEGRGCDWA